ncbi:putative Protein P21 [Hibiscus syriacus]|uniref:non-specific serine/threonine protein kinase n=1 Tax=Hibiscus syriacus TaxID=106335 RepID=A0A6A3C2Q5_HIBSY|nr:putative Protein P21 [Hibiscus syriacus]
MDERPHKNEKLETFSVTNTLKDLCLNTNNISSSGSHSLISYSKNGSSNSGSFQDVNVNKNSVSISLRSSASESANNTSFSKNSESSDCEESEKGSFRSFCPHKGNDRRWDAIQHVKGKDGDLGLAHFRLLKKLGCGDIGSVYLAELTGMECLFAMKLIYKGMLAGGRNCFAVEGIFIISSNDSRTSVLPNQQHGLFLSFKVLCFRSPSSLEYLHKMGVSCSEPSCIIASYCIQPACIDPACKLPVYVEPPWLQPSCFKPRFLSSKTAKVKSERTNVEMVMAVDWWTFGILLYELLLGRTLFKGNDNRETLFNVVGQSLKFTEGSSISFAAKDLIRGLLVKDPQKRLGFKRGATEIKQHPFFESVNWALIRSTHPPEIPKPIDIPLLNQAFKSSVPPNDQGATDSFRSSGPCLDLEFF